MKNQLFTEIKIEPYTQKIEPTSKILTIGSCFSEVIAKHLTNNKFSCTSNPSGTLYNPLSIAQLLQRLHSPTPYNSENLFNHQEYWHSFDHHSKFSGSNPEQVLTTINQSLKQGHNQLKNCNWLILTFGTSFAWFLKSNPNQLVANCHRLPANTFTRRSLTINEIITCYQNLINNLITINPKLNIILTVSPIRHLRNSASENTLSKAKLIVAVQQLIQTYKNTHYFPAYEIMMDHLRDYRFYQQDMVHPSELAQQIIWQQFSQTALTQQAQKLIKIYQPIIQAKKHKIINPNSQQTKKFAQTFIQKIEKLQQLFPTTNFETDKCYFTKLL